MMPKPGQGFCEADRIQREAAALLERRGDPRFHSLKVTHNVKMSTYRFSLFFLHTREKDSYYRAYDSKGVPAQLKLEWEVTESAIETGVGMGLLIDTMMIQAWYDIVNNDIQGIDIICGYYERLDGVRIWLKRMWKPASTWTRPLST